MKFQKVHWSVWVLALYVLLSAAFIGRSLWNDFVSNYAENAFMEGRAYTVQELINQTSDGTCEPVTVFNESSSVKLLNADCVASSKPVETEGENL